MRGCKPIPIEPAQPDPPDRSNTTETAKKEEGSPAGAVLRPGRQGFSYIPLGRSKGAPRTGRPRLPDDKSRPRPPKNPPKSPPIKEEDPQP